MVSKMKNKKIVVFGALAVLATTVLLTGCATDAETASYNLSQAADQFEVERRIVFLNGITDTYLLSIEGRCSILDDSYQLEVTCKIGPDQYKKHFLGLSDNVSYFVEQMDAVDVSLYNYRVVFKPTSIVPDIRVETGNQ